MGQNKRVRFGPVALTTTMTTNILNPGTLTGGVGMPAGANLHFILRHIRILNKTGAAATFSLWLGATGANAAGTEVIGTAKSVPANDYIDWYGELRMDVADFLVGGAGTTLALTFEAEGEIGVA